MSLFTVHTTATTLVALATIPDRIVQIIPMFVLGILIDLDHFAQKEKFLYAFRNRKEKGFVEAWRGSKHLPQTATNWLHSWPFGLALGATTIFLQFSLLPLIVFAVHMAIDGVYYFKSPEFRYERSILEIPVAIRRSIFFIYTFFYGETEKEDHC